MRRISAVIIAASAVLAVGVQAPAAHAATPKYKNCTALNKKYKHGVGRSKAVRDHVRGRSKPVKNFTVSASIYNANKKMDRDKDGIACEKR